jgi:hypothetical protein
VVRPRLDEPVSRGKELNLVTLDEVFDYFLPAMEQREHYLAIIAAYNAIQAKVREPLAVKAFKPLALLWVASRVRTGPGETQYLDVDLSSDQVASYINVADHAAVMEALDALRPTGFVYFDTSTQRYFYSHADPGWDLESEIQEKAADADANDVLQSELRALGFRVCLQVPDTVTVKVDRSVESEWMDIEQLKQATSLKARRAEGKLVFVVPDFAEMQSYDAMFSDISLKARDLSASNVALAVPKKVDVLNPMELKRYRALQEIGKELDVGGRGSVNEHRARLVRARFSEVQSRVQRDIEEFGQASNFIFWVDRKPQEAQAVKTILEDMFEGFYYKFPKVRVERIVGRSTTNALIESCIVNPETTFASDTSEVARQARDTLQVLGLCSWEEAAGGKYVVRLTEPVPGTDGYEIWRIVLDTLSDAAGTPFATLYKRLGQDPYGLPDYMVELYIAAARALSKIYVLDNAGRMPPVSKELVQGITRRKDKDYRVLPVEETEVPYTYTCSVWQAIDEPLGLRHYKELERNLGRSIDDQTVWFDLKADCNNLLLNWLQRVRDNLESIETESRPLMIVMGHLEQIRRILPPAQGLKQLAALGEELSGSKVSDDPDRAALAVRETIEASEQFLTDWDALWSAFRQYKRLLQVSDLDHFGDLARTTEKAWQSYRSDGLSAENRQLFIRRFEDLWEQYAKEYVDEHNAVARARAKYGETVQTSVQYKVLGEFSQLGFEGVATKSSFDAKIKTVRDEGCQALSEDRVRDYRHFGGAACSCGHRLGTGAAILAELKAGEASLSIGVNNALASYHTKLGGVLGSEGMQIYASERATAKEKTTIASLQDLSREEPELSATQYGKLEALLPRLRPILQGAEEYLGAQAENRKELKKRLEEEQRQKRIPRQRTVHLADAVRSFLLRSGLEAMTLKELEEQLSSWLREIAEEFRR